MKTLIVPSAGARSSRGVSLIIVLIMLVIIGITAATAMRTATSEQRATNNLRVEATAQQYAEAALRFCEAEMQKATAARLVQFRSPIPTSTAASPNWETVVNWTAVADPAGRYTLTAGQVSDLATNAPLTLPQCMFELQTRPVAAAVPDVFTVTVITARGFSTDYARNAGTGETTQGAVVWLQSIINAE